MTDAPTAGLTDTEWAKASGKATLYSFGLMHQKFPGFEDETPYVFAVVELEEGPRIVSDVVDVPAAELRCDMPLRAVFDDVADDTTLVPLHPLSWRRWINGRGQRHFFAMLDAVQRTLSVRARCLRRGPAGAG